MLDAGRVLVVHRPRYDDWSLPKGHVDPGETWAATALREVEEETGVRATICGAPRAIAYVLADHTPKVVVFHPMTLSGPRLPDDALVGDPAEVDAVEWWPLERALAELSYPDERRVLGELLERDGQESGDSDSG